LQSYGLENVTNEKEKPQQASCHYRCNFNFNDIFKRKDSQHQKGQYKSYSQKQKRADIRQGIFDQHKGDAPDKGYQHHQEFSFRAFYITVLNNNSPQ